MSRAALPRRVLALALLILCAASVATDSASAANTPLRTGVLSISPARRNIAGRPPLQLSSTLVQNTTELTMKVTVFPTLLVQYLDGTFGFNETRRELSEARLELNTGPTRFTLAPRQAQTVSLRWNVLPRGAKAAYLGLLVQGVPQTKRGQGVGTILRLLGMNFFTLPGHWTVTGRITALRGEQGGPRVLRFLPRVRNTGQIPSEPRRARCAITDANGGVVVRRRFGPGIILPGYEREYPVLVKKPLPAGSYSITCSTQFGRTRSSKRWAFRLSGPNTLPTPELDLTAVKATGEIGRPAKLAIDYRNVGLKAAPVVLRVSLVRLGTNGIAAGPTTRATYRRGVLGGRAHATADEQLGKVDKGSYRATVTITNGHAVYDRLTTDFTARAHHGPLARIWRRIMHNLPWLLLLLVLLGLLLFFLWKRRRRDEDEEDREPPPRPPPVLVRERIRASRRINLNSASIDELMQLPSVGRRAAERIVAFREADGGFKSVDDLRAIEGFHDERIRRLADVTQV